MIPPRRQSASGQGTNEVHHYVSPKAVVLAFLALCLCIATLELVGSALNIAGLSRWWACFIVPSVMLATGWGWQAFRRRRKLAKHQAWVSNLGNDFRKRLEQGRQANKKGER